jgi:hypothetical protein
MMDNQKTRLYEPHVKPLTLLVEELRARGHQVPDVDPNDGGVNAHALFLLTTPGPEAVVSGFVSCDNPDPTAENMRKSWEVTGIQRKHVALWNVVPYCLSTPNKSQNPTPEEIQMSAPDTQRFIDLFPKLRVIVFCGTTHTQQAIQWLHIPSHIERIITNHTGNQAFSHNEKRENILKTFRYVAELILTHPRSGGHDTSSTGSQSSGTYDTLTGQKLESAMIRTLLARKSKKDDLRATTLEIATTAGYQLRRRPGRSLIFDLPDGRTVRLRTSSHRCLQITTTSPDMDNAKLDIEGADLLLFGATETKHETSAVEAYLVPTHVAATAVRSAHKAWLAAGAASKGSNSKPAIWFDKALPTSDMFSEKWAKYRIGRLTFQEVEEAKKLLVKNA